MQGHGREQEPCSKRTLIPSAQQRLNPSSQQGAWHRSQPKCHLPQGTQCAPGTEHRVAENTRLLYSCVVTSYLKGKRRHVGGHRSKSDDLQWQSVPQRSSRDPDVTSWPQGHWTNLREEPGMAGSLRSNYSGGS